MAVLILKLINGTEVIGTLVDDNAKVITLANPAQINYKNIESSVPSVSLTRYMQFSKTKQHTFERSKIFSAAEPIKGMCAYYQMAIEHFENEIDEIVHRELERVVKSESEETQSDQYLAILERLTSNQTLN
jgi:hypothetical protein